MNVEPTFEFSSKTQKIQIDYNQTYPDLGQCSIHGWGSLDDEFPDLPDILQTVDLKIFDFKTCSDIYDEYEAQLDEKVHFCAYNDEKDSCYGDSGSPVVSDDGQLIGLVSFGIGCAQKDKPGVYTRITAFQEFIETFNGSNSTFYDTRLGFFGVMMSLFMIFKKY